MSFTRIVVFLSLALLPLLLAGQESVQDDKKKEEEGLPLKAESKIEFTTDEGTWMSLHISPEGQTIVFDLLGDIYTLPIGGGEAKRVIGGISFESQPKYSPDGKQIVFLSDRSGAENVWISDADGSNPRALTKGRNQQFLSPSWTPDGEYIIVSRSGESIGTYSLKMYHREGGSGISLGPPDPPPPPPDSNQPQPPRQNKMGAVASPDGRFVYYAMRTGSFAYNTAFPIWQVVRFDRDTSDTSTITNAQGSAMRPVLSPDGRKLIYATRFETKTGLRVRDLETSEERWLIYPVTRDDQESRATRDTMPGYAFMPDGKSLIVPIDGKIHRVDTETGKSALIPFTAKVEAEVAATSYFQARIDDSPMVRSRLIRWPTQSPDGRRLAFGSLNKIWTMDLPAGKPKRLTGSSAGEFMPTWSPDGRSIAYVTWSSQGGHIFRMSSDGTGQAEQLTRRPAYYSAPVYTPDGDKIVFTSGATSDQLYSDLRENAEPDVYGQEAEISGIGQRTGLDFRWIPARGGDSTLIASAAGARATHFTADAGRFYFTTNGGLVSIRLDGLDRRTHFRVTGNAPGPNPRDADEIVLSPDGARAFVHLQNKHYMVSVPKAGKETVTVNVNSAALPVKKMSAEGGDFLTWSKDGKTVAWGWGSKFYWQNVAEDKPQVADAVIEVSRARPDGSVVLRGARIVTMKGDEVIERGDVVLTGNRITAVGATGRVQAPANARVIDVAGKTIIPGFVDAHSHMWAPRGVHQTQVWQYLANLAYGVTTTRDPQTSTTDVFSYADLIESGEILGPRVFATGPGVFNYSGLDDKETTRNLIRRYKEAYNTNTLKAYTSGDRIARQWVIMATKEFGISPTTEGALDMKLDLSQMADGFSGLEHSLPVQPIYRDVAEFVARTKTFYTPTTLVAYGAPWTENLYFETTDLHANEKIRRYIPHELLDTMVRRRRQWFMSEEYGHKGIAEGVARIVRAGGRVGVGSHGQMQGVGYHWELWSIQSGGLSPHEALRIATLYGAEAIGLQQDVGSIEYGKLADLIVLDQNPLLDIRNTNTIRFVMKNGELFDGHSLDRVWPSPKKLDPMYWWNSEPKR